jgi:hypothetical protein
MAGCVRARYGHCSGKVREQPQGGSRSKLPLLLFCCFTIEGDPHVGVGDVDHGGVLLAVTPGVAHRNQPLKFEIDITILAEGSLHSFHIRLTSSTIPPTSVPHTGEEPDTKLNYRPPNCDGLR